MVLFMAENFLLLIPTYAVEGGGNDVSRRLLMLLLLDLML